MLINNSIIEKNRGEREAKSLYEFRGGWLQIKRIIYGEESRERNLLNIYLCYVVKKKREGGRREGKKERTDTCVPFWFRKMYYYS